MWLTASAAAAQTPALPISTDGTDPKNWDPKLEAGIAAPGNHKLVYEDANIRVISVSIPARTEEPYHFHRYYSVLIVDGNTKIADRDAKGIETRAPVMGLIPNPLVIVQAPQAVHSIKNLDAVPAHLIRIEFKKGFPAEPGPQMPLAAGHPISTDGSDPASWDMKREATLAAPGNHKLVYEDTNIRVLEVNVPPGTEEPAHLHPYPSVLVFDSFPKAVDRDATGEPTFASPLAEIRTPVVLTLEPQAAHSIKNLDNVPVHLTRIEFKHGFPPATPH